MHYMGIHCTLLALNLKNGPSVSDVAFASVHYETTRPKKLIIIIIITIN